MRALCIRQTPPERRNTTGRMYCELTLTLMICSTDGLVPPTSVTESMKASSVPLSLCSFTAPVTVSTQLRTT